MDSLAQHSNNIKVSSILALLSFVLFVGLSLVGFFVGEALSHEVLINSFGLPKGEQVFFFALVSGVSEIVFFLFGIPMTIIIMHQIGRRSKLAVGKPTLYGFILYLLTLLILIINYNQTH